MYVSGIYLGTPRAVRYLPGTYACLPCYPDTELNQTNLTGNLTTR